MGLPVSRGLRDNHVTVCSAQKIWKYSTLITLAVILSYGILLSTALRFRGLRNVSTPVPSRGGSVTRPSQITVIGATGGTGKAIVAEALERGFRVIAFVRDPSKLAVRHPNLSIVRGDLLDPDSIAAALPGSGAVLSALGHRNYFSLAWLHTRGTENLVRAMESAGVSRFICETSIGLGDSAGRCGLIYTFFLLPFVLPIYFWDKGGQERKIGGSSLEWTIVRPVGLSNGPSSGAIRHGAGIGSFLLPPRIPRAAVAGFMLDQLETDIYLRRTPGVSAHPGSTI